MPRSRIVRPRIPRPCIPRSRRLRRRRFPAPRKRTGLRRFVRTHRIQIVGALLSGTLPAAADFLGPWLGR
ncbi:hypothetical protein [Streptomyces telluris]|uniref:Uncharacterized protein n=1 Tax=Streptomyces telluris TaxID=2720021 RepID=A0A9X2LBX4_9ACTN|nr:hypothetical protein [Streptomyces telluris]MCQ8768363.1 hypothetical protein [Streptomyces telluris]NJP77372.1 hypothetical protein [Streptomyces telluris]